MKPLVFGIGYFIIPPPHRNSWLRSRFEESGPTYIKLGQFISHRKDVFGSELSNSMLSLKDKVKPIPWDRIENCIDHNIFSYVDPVPIATASIAQVHKAIMNDGTQVAVKIKKPNVNSDFRKELGELKIISSIFPSLKPMVSEFEKSIHKELDFCNEIRNIKHFAEMYEYSSAVIIPSVFEKYSNDQVIVMKYVPSDFVKPSAKKLIMLFVNQLLYETYIHGDLHSGNIGSSNGATVLYDFGNVIKTTPKYRQSVRDFVFAIQTKDPDETLKALETMGFSIKNKETSLAFIQKFFVYLETLDIKSLRFDPDEIQEKIPMQLDQTTTSILRSYSLLEGYCKKIDSTFSYDDILQETIELLIIDSISF